MADKIEDKRQLKKEDAIDILDRIIGFINNCDNKAAIMLGLFCAIIALVLSTDGVVEIKRIIETTIVNKSFYSVLFLFLWFVSFAILFAGIYNLLMAVKAKIDCSEMKKEALELDSKIYFADISKNSTFQEYKQKLLSLDEESLLNDLISEIYINSCICTAKFERYNKGLRLSLVGYSAFGILWGIGSYIF